MPTNFKCKILNMWHKVNELSAKGLKNWQISLILGIHRDTVRRYRKMPELEVIEWVARPYHNRRKKLSDYSGYVAGLLKEAPYLTSPQILDKLKETYDDIPEVSDKTVYNFVEALRVSLSLPKEKEQMRQMVKLPEPDYGQEAQVDWGEKRMLTDQGRWKKVYFFVMVMSRSRQKFVYFQDIPFTAKATVYAHHLAFEHFGGMPEKILYDQDAVLIVAENLGDYRMTEEMESFRKSAGYTAIFCRAADPQSKGKVENVVGYVKKNFIQGRKFTTVEALNEQVLGWLERTGNGHRHASTRLIPAEEFEKEREHLKPYNMRIEKPVTQGRLYTVRRDNTISYHGCYYQLPVGTYEGDDTQVRVVESEQDTIEIFNAADSTSIITYTISALKGKLVTKPELKMKDSSDPTPAENEIRKRMERVAGCEELATAYIRKIHEDRPRYYNKSVKILRDLFEQIPDSMMAILLTILDSNKVLNAYDAVEIANGMMVRNGHPQLSDVPNRYGQRGNRKRPSANLDPQRSNITAYDELVATLTSQN